MLVVRNSDRISFKVKHNKDEIELIFRPLTNAEKGELAQFTDIEGGAEMVNRSKALALILKKTILKVKGFRDLDGNEWEPTRDEDGLLTDDSVDVLLNTPVYGRISVIGWNLLNSVPSVLLDPTNGREMKDVKVKFLKESQIKK